MVSRGTVSLFTKAKNVTKTKIVILRKRSGPKKITESNIEKHEKDMKVVMESSSSEQILTAVKKRQLSSQNC